MVIRRQKLFVLPAALSLGNVLTGGMLVQGGVQMKQSADQAEEAEAQNRQQIKALNRLAKAAEQNPAIAQQVAGNTANIKQKESSNTGSILEGIQKEFAGVNSQTLKNAQGFLKDMGTFAWGKRKHIVSGLAMGSGMAIAGAAVDKAIQHDIKKNNLPFLDKQKQEQPTQQQFSDINYLEKGKELAQRGGKSFGREFKSAFDFSIKKGKGWMPKMGGGYMTAAFASMPVAGYIAEKKQYQDQLKSTTPQQSEQKQFAKVNGSIFKNISNWWKSNPGERGLNWVANFANNGQNGKQMAQEISKIGSNSGNKWTQATGKWLENHGKTAALGAIGVGGAVMSTGWGQGEKLTKKAIKAVDKNAYAYEDSKNQQVPQ